MKIGIMGGTFDPIHNGHLMLARCALTQFHLDKIWFLPNGKPPHKRSQEADRRLSDRLHMVELAIAGEPDFELCTYEAERKEVSYSYSTMETFKRRWPEHEFYFIVGADSVLTLEQWKHPERLAKTCTFLAACRDDIDFVKMSKEVGRLERRYGAKILFLKTPAVPVSSSEIRRKLASGYKKAGLLPEDVWNYINEKHLYEGDETNGSDDL